MNKPLVSICSITYNHAPYIRECLDGLLRQRTSFSFEIIINDDCSTDGTTEIIKEYERKYPDIIHPIFHKDNQYQKGERGIFQRFVFPKAQGQYIALCEGDDYWTDSLKLQKQVDFLEQNPEYGMIYSKAKFFYQKTLEFSNSDWGGPSTEFRDLILYPYCIPTASIVLRKNLIDSFNNHWELNKKKWKMSDYPLSLFCALNSKIHFIPKSTTIYRVLESSASHFCNINDDIDFLNSVYDVKRYFISISQDPNLATDLEPLYNYEIWRRAIKYKEYELAKKYAFLINDLTLKERLLKLMSQNKVTFNILYYIKQKFGKK